MTFANMNTTCRKGLSARSLCGTELGTHEAAALQNEETGLTSRRIAQWTVMMTKPWTESKTAKRIWWSGEAFAR